MRAVTITRPGGPDVLAWAEVPDPAHGEDEVLIDVAAAAVNRADIMQRQGVYPPPPGASPYPGLECSGRVIAVGSAVTGWHVGDEVCALLPGGAYAERVAAAAQMLLPIPAGVGLVEAAALPEAACTVWSNVFMLAGLRSGEVLLVHGGASGIGTFAIQLARARGATVCTTASAGKHAALQELGAELVIDYRAADFVSEVRSATAGGADVVLDIMGGPYMTRNVEALAPDGRLVVIAVQGGNVAQLDLAAMMGKRITVATTTLRSRPPEQKARIVREVRDQVWPLLADGSVRPVVDRVLPLEQAAEAHKVLEASAHIGKIVLVRS